MVTVKSQPRGLGKGLSALISEINTIPAEQPPTGGLNISHKGIVPAREIHLKAIISGPFQPRKNFSQAQLEELAASIKSHGVMQPILVRIVGGSGGSAAFQIVAGERRWRAAQMAGLETIPALVRELTDQQAMELALIENIQRADLSPLEEGMGYQRLLNEFGYTQEALSGIVGKSRSHITNLLRLLTLPEPIKALMDESKLSMGHARALVGMEEGRAVAMAQSVVAKGLSVRQIEQLARGDALPEEGAQATPKPRTRRARSQASEPKDNDILALEETLSGSLGMPVSIDQEDGQRGSVSIAYETLTQLDELLRRLSGGV